VNLKFSYLYLWFLFWGGGLQGATLIGPSQKMFFQNIRHAPAENNMGTTWENGNDKQTT
jgi:hypothetical protein